MSERRRCDTCIFWRRMTGQRGACSKVFTSQKRRLKSTDRNKANTVGWLVTRQNDYCPSHRPKDVIPEQIDSKLEAKPPSNRGDNRFLSVWERTEHNYKLERLRKIHHLGLEICAERLGLSVDETRSLLRKLRKDGELPITRPAGTKRWPEMDETVRLYYVNTDAKILAAMLTKEFGIPVTRNMVIGRANRLGLAKRKKRGRYGSRGF